MRQPILGANPVRPCWINDLVHRINVPCVPCRRMINANSMLLWDIVYTKYYRLLDSCVVKTNITVSKWDIRFFMVPDFFIDICELWCKIQLIHFFFLGSCWHIIWQFYVDTTLTSLEILQRVWQPNEDEKGIKKILHWSGKAAFCKILEVVCLFSCAFFGRRQLKVSEQVTVILDIPVDFMTCFLTKHVGCMWIWVVRTVWCGWWMLLFSIYLFFR